MWCPKIWATVWVRAGPAPGVKRTFCFSANCYSQLVHQVSSVPASYVCLTSCLSSPPYFDDLFKLQYINPASSHVRCWREARKTKVSTFVSQKDRNRAERGSLIHCLPAWLSHPTCVGRFISSCLLELRQCHQRTPASVRGTPETRTLSPHLQSVC